MHYQVYQVVIIIDKFGCYSYYNMQGQDINIQEIIEALNQSATDNEHMSLRFSDDYQLNYHRYTNEDEFQEITFDLSNDEQSQDLELSIQNDLEIHQENTLEQLQNVVESLKQEPVHSKEIEKPSNNSKIISLNRKTSLKTTQRLKKKISLRKQVDQFTKKYDDLFDQIFLKKKDKQEKSELKEECFLLELKKDQSTISTNHQNLTGSNVSENNVQPIHIVSQTSIFKTEPATEKPKITIKYQGKQVFDQKQKESKQQKTKPPKINFSYASQQAISIPKKQTLGPFAISNCVAEELRLPAFLVPFRNRTNNYPNFYNKKVLEEESCNKINKQFKEMLDQCMKSIIMLKEAHLKLHQLFKYIRELYRLMNANIQKLSQPDQGLVNFFLSVDWEGLMNAKELQTIRPKDFFLNRVFNELQFITLVNNFEEILIKMEYQQAFINVQNPQSIKRYMDSRDKLWGIEKNLRLMSEDLYLHSLSHFNLPSHIFHSYNFLKQARQSNDKMDHQKERMLGRLLFLQQKKDIFSISWLGVYTIKMLCNLSK